MDLRNQIIKELKDSIAKDDEKIKEYDDKISTAYFAKNTITDGAFASTARAKIDRDISKYEREKQAIVTNSTWKREMINKYK